jgi:PilZ domain
MAMIHEGEDAYLLAAQEDRSAPRTKLSIPALLRPSGSKGFQTVVQDLSLSGFSAVAVNRMHLGTLCWLTLPGLESQQAEVIWWDSGLAGCAFHQLLSPIVHDNLLTRWTGDSAIRLQS